MSYQLHLQTKLIAIKRIDCPRKMDYFGYTEDQIDLGSTLFLEAKGIINPLILKRTNNIYDGVAIDDETPDGRYEVVSGFLEYFCAVRAREINPAQECVQAIIRSNSIAENLTKQIELFRIREVDLSVDDLDFELEADVDLDDVDLDLLFDRVIEGK